MANWKKKIHLEETVREHIKTLPVAIEEDKNKLDSLTRTWSIPIHNSTLNSIIVIIPLVLDHEHIYSNQSKKSKKSRKK